MFGAVSVWDRKTIERLSEMDPPDPESDFASTEEGDSTSTPTPGEAEALDAEAEPTEVES
jgi:hypothetical protein